MTRPISMVGRVRSSTNEFTASTRTAQPPTAFSRSIRSPIRPFRPTSLRKWSRFNCDRSMREANSFNVSATFPSRPVKSEGMRTEKSPSLKVLTVANSLRLKPSPSFDSAPFALDLGSFISLPVRDLERPTWFEGRGFASLTFFVVRRFSSFALFISRWEGGMADGILTG